ncbi:MAG: 16S rRNA (guanine(527)-N(7))-methyltransferase RsmG [Paracoccaceae bacterium]
MKDANPARLAFQKRFNVSRETIERLQDYVLLLKRWNPTINLISRSTVSDIWTRHIEDSAQIWELREDSAINWLDLGSGGGFPGLVIAVLAKGCGSKIEMTLVESDGRKAAFLTTCARELGVSARILKKRVEEVDPQYADIISARALAPLETLLGYGNRHIRHGGTLLLHKGKSWESELTKCEKYWTFQLEKHRSRTDPSGVLLKIGGLRRAEP